MGDEMVVANAWQGARVRLRAVEPSDWQFHYDWNRSTDDCRMYDFVYFPGSTRAAQQWAERESASPPPGDEVRFQIENFDGELVGSINTHSCNRRVGTFSYGVVIHSALRQRGYASDAIRLVLRHYFDERRYQKVTVVVYDFNTPSIRLHERLGFLFEGRMRRMEYTNGRYADHLLYGLTIEEWRAAQPVSP